MHKLRHAAAALAAAALALVPLSASAQDYPTRPVTIVVPFSPGGPGDLTARFLAEGLQKQLGQTFIVENKPGANGVLAAQAAARAPADGYTLMQISSSHTANESLVPKRGYELMKDFEPIASLNFTENVLMVKNDLPVKSVAELIAYRTPNIDSIGEQGVVFTDYYGEQSCTAGRASFITGQCGLRTGLTKVGLPGAALGMRAEDPNIPELLKPMGYATGQFGKNHFGDRDEHLPTMHGFDEFFGNLYHLNAEEEPELPDYPNPKDFPNFHKNFGPRGVLHTWSDGKGGQKIENTGPLTKERMKTCDVEFMKAAKAFIKKAVKADKPFFVWFNTTHMHFRTHIEDRIRGQAGRWQSEYHDCMIEHDKNIGEMLALLDELGVADNTMVMYSTDNGPHMNSWPDAGMTPFRNEKNSNWEGAYRVPCMVRWPGVVKPGTVSNEIVSHLDWLPTIVAAAGDPDVKQKLLKGHEANGKKFKVHLDGFNLVPYLTGKAKKPDRKGFLYFTDDGDLACLRFDNWKVVFMEQRVQGTLRIWAEPLVTLRVPKIFNLRTDPYERADVTSNTYYDWLLDHVFILVPAQAGVADFLKSFKEYPPRQKAASFGVDQVIEKMTEAAGGGQH